MISVDLSAATKLKHLAFRCVRPNVQWVTKALQTVESEDLRLITFRPGPDTFLQLPESIRQQWQDLDRLLVQFWTSHSIRTKVTYQARGRGDDLTDHLPSLLPELTRRGLVDLVDLIGYNN